MERYHNSFLQNNCSIFCAPHMQDADKTPPQQFFSCLHHFAHQFQVLQLPAAFLESKTKLWWRINLTIQIRVKSKKTTLVPVLSCRTLTVYFILSHSPYRQQVKCWRLCQSHSQHIHGQAGVVGLVSQPLGWDCGRSKRHPSSSLDVDTRLINTDSSQVWSERLMSSPW